MQTPYLRVKILIVTSCWLGSNLCSLHRERASFNVPISERRLILWEVSLAREWEWSILYLTHVHDSKPCSQPLLLWFLKKDLPGCFQAESGSLLGSHSPFRFSENLVLLLLMVDSVATSSPSPTFAWSLRLFICDTSQWFPETVRTPWPALNLLVCVSIF